MIQLLFLIVCGEVAAAVLLLVEIGPLRDLVMRCLEQLQSGRGPATLKTIGCTMGVILLSSVANILRIQSRTAKLGTATPMDQVLWRTHLLEAVLIGFSLVLGFIIDRMHLHLQKLINISSSIEAAEKEADSLRRSQFRLQEKEEKASREVKKLREEVSTLNECIKKIKQESEEKGQRAAAAEAQVIALQKQAEDLLLEYDRLLEDNQNLQIKFGIRS